MDKSSTARITLWDFKTRLAPRETLWLRDQSTGKVVARGGRRLRRYRNVVVTGCYPAVSVDEDGSTVRSVLVCWGSHEEIVAANRGSRWSCHEGL